MNRMRCFCSTRGHPAYPILSSAVLSHPYCSHDSHTPIVLVYEDNMAMGYG